MDCSGRDINQRPESHTCQGTKSRKAVVQRRSKALTRTRDQSGWGAQPARRGLSAEVGARQTSSPTPPPFRRLGNGGSCIPEISLEDKMPASPLERSPNSLETVHEAVFFPSKSPINHLGPSNAQGQKGRQKAVVGRCLCHVHHRGPEGLSRALQNPGGPLVTLRE